MHSILKTCLFGLSILFFAQVALGQGTVTYSYTPLYTPPLPGSYVTYSYTPLYTPPLPTPSSGTNAIPKIKSIAASVTVAAPPQIPNALSPETSQLNFLRDLPVNKYAGAPIINIPITELKEGSLSIPLSLSYQTTGIKANQVASWVGLGWDLTGIPMITRVVRDLPDEGHWDYNGNAMKGYYSNSAIATNTSSNLTNDTEPDFFFFNFQGQAIKFVFDYQGNAYFDPAIDAQVKVELSNSYNSSLVNKFSKITITLPDGTSYYFSDQYNESTVEVKVEDVFNFNLYPGTTNFDAYAKYNKTTSAWFCYKITHPLGHSIQFNYNKQAYSYYKLAEQLDAGYLPRQSSYKLNRVFIFTNAISSIEGSLTKIVFNDGLNQSSSYIDPETGQTITTYFPNGSNARQDLDALSKLPQNTSEGKILKTISLINKANTTHQLVWRFSQDYFTSQNEDLPSNYGITGTFNAVGSTHQKRLKLNNIVFPDLSKFTFNYNSSNFIPSRFTTATDHWGYFNNYNNSAYGQVGKDDDNPNGGGAEKSSDEASMLLGSLLSVSSSSGIHSIYEFEAHRCNNYNAGNSPLGGLRIKSITSIDSIRLTTQTKKYTYLKTDGSSSGFIFVKPKYRFYDDNDSYYHFSGLYNYLISESQRPVLGYERVVEETFSNTDLSLSTGKVETLFNQTNTELSINYVTGGVTKYYLHKFHPSSDPALGSISKEIAYAQNGNKISETSYTYNYPNTLTNLYAYKKNRFQGSPTTYSSENYYVPIQKFRLEQTDQKTYGLGGGGQPLTQSVAITYKDEMPADYQLTYPGKHLLPVKSTTTLPDGSTTETWNKYVGDFTFSIDTTTTRDNVKYYNCLSQYPNDYNYCSAQATIVTIKRHLPISTSDNYGIYTMLDSLKAIPIETIQLMNGLIYQASYFRYTGKAKLQKWYELRKFPLNTFSQLNFSSTDNTLKDAHYGDPQGSITDFNSNNLPLTVTQTYGGTKTYTYDATGFLQLSQTSNANKADALTTSYEYAIPLFGLSKEISPNLLEKRYTYLSGTGQLLNIRDQQNRILTQNEYSIFGGTNNNPNKISQFVARQAVTDENAFKQATNSLQQISYLDGGLQPIQTILKQQNPNQKDIIKDHLEVDAFGRPKKSFLPIPTTQNSGSFVANPLATSQTFYKDQAPYSEQESYESSPRSTPLKTIGAGQAFRLANNNLGKTNQFAVESGGMTKRILSYSNGAPQVSNSTYSAAQLRSETTQDESGNQNKVFYNSQNQVVEQWQISASGETLKTAYVYDALGRPVYTIPPALYSAASQNFNESSSFFNEGIYATRYDSLGRTYQTKAPGNAWVYKVFNALGQVVLEQNGLLREKNLWAWIKYDGHGRIVMKGTLTPGSGVTQSSLQQAFDNLTTDNQFEEPGQQLLGYTNKSYPSAVSIAEANVMAVYYYDNYSQLSQANLAFSSYSSSTAYTNAKGLLCGSLVRRLDTQAFLRSVHYYDDQGRLIQTQTENRFGGINQSDWTYNFAGDLLEEHQIYRKPGAANLEKSHTYTYDNTGRKTRSELNIQGQNFVLASYAYDALGRLQSKSLNPLTNSIVRNSGPSASTADVASSVIQLKPGFLFDARQGNKTYSASIRTLPFQQLDYSYHIRGGLRGINLDANENISLQNGDLFGLKLDHFESGQFFDGKLQKQTWVGSDKLARSYTYQYDSFNRLSSANYGGQGSENYSVNQSYDANGNILTLTRNGKVGSQYTAIDQLNYSYPSNSNKLQAVTDQAQSNIGFVNQTASQEYTYYSDGSLKSDVNKGIQQIDYNYLGLPERVSFSANKYIEWVYDAEGLKLLQRFVNGNQTTTIQYMGDLLYRNDTLVTVFHDEGYLQVQAGQYKLRFNLTDHLGNTRMVLEPRGGTMAVVQETHYGPWGEVLEGLGLSADWAFLYQGKEWISAGGLNWYDFSTRGFDPYLGRFNQTDGANQFASGYVGMGNVPNMGVDPDGQFAFLAAVGIGALVGALTNTASQVIQNRGFKNWNWGSFASGVGIGAVTGAAGFGVGSLFGSTAGESFNLVKEITRASFHGFTNGLISEVTSGNFEQGFISGTFGSFTGSLTNKIENPLVQIGASGVAGGIGSNLTGGNFWEGFAIGGIVTGSNHLLHKSPKPTFKDISDEKRYPGVKIYKTNMIKNGSAVTLPGIGILIADDVGDNVLQLLIQHEYGHFLDFSSIKSLNPYLLYYSLIGAPSLFNLITGWGGEHKYYWTEIRANKFSQSFYGKNYEYNDYYPTK